MIKTENMLSDVIFNEASAPEFIVADGKYTIRAKEGRPYSAGMFETKIDIETHLGKLLKINVPYTSQGGRMSARAMVSFEDADKGVIQSDCFRKSTSEFTLEVEIPEDAKKFKLELSFYCFGKGFYR